jgi:hypothetical protein
VQGAPGQLYAAGLTAIGSSQRQVRILPSHSAFLRGVLWVTMTSPHALYRMGCSHITCYRL